MIFSCLIFFIILHCFLILFYTSSNLFFSVRLPKCSFRVGAVHIFYQNCAPVQARAHFGGLAGSTWVPLGLLWVNLSFTFCAAQFWLLSGIVFATFKHVFLNFPSKSRCTKSYSESRHCFEPRSVLLHSGLGRPAESQSIYI